MSRIAVPTATADGMVIVQTMHDCTVATIACGSLKDKGANSVLNHLSRLAMHSGGRLVVSLDPVSEISLGTLRGVLDLHQRCRDLGGRLVLCCMPSEARRVMNTIAGHTTPTVARSTREAVAVLRGKARRQGIFRRAA